MPRALRLLTLVLSFAALQLTLLGGGPGCALPGSASAAVATSTMVSMDMGGEPKARATSRDAHDRTPAAPCEDSSSAQACRSMAPCLFALSLPEPSVAASELTAVVPILAMRALAPRSVTSAPEIPPPRA
jgi:hypothetical protein